MALYKISTYSQYTEVFILFFFYLCCFILLRIFRQNAKIEHFSYAYLRVLFIACDGRRRGDLIDLFEAVARYHFLIMAAKPCGIRQETMWRSPGNHVADCQETMLRIATKPCGGRQETMWRPPGNHVADCQV